MASTTDVQDEYPNFEDADVLILSATGRSWKLQSQILANGSSVLKNMFKDAPRKRRRPQKGQDTFVRWTLQMMRHPAATRVDPDGTHYMELMDIVSDFSTRWTAG
jgi:hypothetical protein